MNRFFILFALLAFVACSQSEKKETTSDNLSEKVEAMLDADMYTDALNLLNAQPETEEVLTLKEKTYLNYGLFLEYRDSDVTNMRDKMTNAMWQYIEVLKINPDNEKAISEVEQILGIYSTFPNRKPDPEVIEKLKELGFNV